MRAIWCAAHSTIDSTAAGASFGEKMGVERPNWFAAAGEEPITRYAFTRQNWFERSRAEHLAARESVALFDQSGFGKFEISGPDALAVLQRVCSNDVDVDPGRVVYTAMLTSRGTFASDLTVLRTAPDVFMMVTGTAQYVADRAWLARHVAPWERLTVLDRSADFAVLGLMGPRSRELLGGECDADLSNEGFPFATTRGVSLAGSRAAPFGSPTWASSGGSCTRRSSGRVRSTRRCGRPGDGSVWSTAAITRSTR